MNDIETKHEKMIIEIQEDLKIIKNEIIQSKVNAINLFNLHTEAILVLREALCMTDVMEYCDARKYISRLNKKK